MSKSLRRYAEDEALAAVDAAFALEDLRALDLQRLAHGSLLGRVWELRQNLSADDAVYVGLAEVLETTLLACDGRLARAPHSRVVAHWPAHLQSWEPAGRVVRSGAPAHQRRPFDAGTTSTPLRRPAPIT